MVTQFTQPSDQMPGGGEQSLVDRFLRLACLTYTADGPERLGEARGLLAGDPGLAHANIHTMAAVGDVAAAAELLARDRSQARRRGGPHGWEPILYAAYSRLDSSWPGHSTFEVARLLLEHGADPNAGFLGSWGPPPFTALTGAFGYGEDAPNQPPHQYELEFARLLLEAGADANDEQTVYNNHWRKSNEHLELLFAYGLGTGDGGPWHRRLAPMHATPAQMLEDQLLFAADAGALERVELLLRHGVDVEGLGTRHPILRGRSALELALANGQSSVVEVLEAAGAASAKHDSVEELLAACMRGDEQRVRELLASGDKLAAEAVTRDPRQIVKAAELDRPDAVRLLAEVGFDVNYKQGATSLHLAAYAGNRRMVDLLLELGADPSLKDDDFDATAAGWARHAHHDELADYLTDHETA
jgi:ankyrin repeat protein